MNVQMALRLAEDEGRHVAIVKARDDIASAPKMPRTNDMVLLAVF